MRVNRTAGTVTVSRAEVEAFADKWPCSGLHDAGPIVFSFDGRGDLVDLSGDPEGADGAALSALVDDARAALDRAVGRT